MRTGRSLTELAAEIQRQANSKKDYIAPATKLAMAVPEYQGGLTGEPSLTMENGRRSVFGITQNAHEQIAGRLEIPRGYYDRMRQHEPTLLASNVNTWLKKSDSKFMVRTMDGDVRALLSNRYRPLDNYDLAEAVLPKLIDAGCRVESCELTDSRLYIKAVTDRIQMDVKTGDVVQAGMLITNSEIGLGAIKIEPLVYRLICLNGAVINDMAMRRKHVGKRHDFLELESADQYFRDETRTADDRAFWMKVSDVVTAMLDQAVFQKIVGRWQEATTQEITKDPVEVVQLVAKRFTLNDTERSGVLTHLIKGGDLSAYGLMNAVTRMAQDVPSYDRSTELEHVGPAILELPKAEWRVLAEV